MEEQYGYWYDAQWLTMGGIPIVDTKANLRSLGLPGTIQPYDGSAEDTYTAEGYLEANGIDTSQFATLPVEE